MHQTMPVALRVRVSSWARRIATFEDCYCLPVVIKVLLLNDCFSVSVFDFCEIMMMVRVVWIVVLYCVIILCCVARIYNTNIDIENTKCERKPDLI